MDIDGAIANLAEAYHSASPCSGLAIWIDARSPDDGYAVQWAAARRHAAAGRVAIGYKIGLTSPAVQAKFGASEPMYGTLYEDSLEPADASINSMALCTPKLEGEILLRVGTPPAHDADDLALLASISSVHAAFEIADSRVAEWRIGIGEAIADNACCGRFGYVASGKSADAVDLAAVRMTIAADADGQILSSGRGSDCLRSPLFAYRWLIGKLARHGCALREGDLILTGALGPMVNLDPGKIYTITLAELGTLKVRT